MHIQKQRHYFANKGPSSQGYGFSSGHVWMWELDCEESWVPNNWCFWTVVLKTLESLLQHHSSKASILQHSAFFTVQLSHLYMTTGKTISLTRWTFANKVPSSQGYGFSSSHVWMWELVYKESWALKSWCFWTVVLKTLESPLDCKEPWDFFGRTDAKAETPVHWPPHAKSWLIGKYSDAGKDWRQEEKGATEKK